MNSQTEAEELSSLARKNQNQTISKKKLNKTGWFAPLVLFVILSMLLAACGDSQPTASAGDFGQAGVTQPANGDDNTDDGTCDGKGEVTGQILVLTDANQDLQTVPATVTLTTAGAAPRTLTTDADGNYQVDGLDINEYEVEASIPGGVNGKTVQPKKKYLTVDDCQVETVSMVLLADGVTAPDTPPPPPTQQVVYVNQQPHYSITSNPFFWLWLLDRPGYYGYSYPPVYTTRIYNNNHTIYVPQAPRPPANPRYTYTSYKPGDTTATKVKSDPPVVSKGSTRIGSSGYSKPPVTKSASTGSKGSSRPGGSSGSVTTPKSGSSGSSSSANTPKSGSGSSSSSGSSNVKPPSGSSKGSGSSNVKPPSGGSKGGTRPGGKKK